MAFFAILYVTAGIATAVTFGLPPEKRDHMGVAVSACAACIVLWPVVLILMAVFTLLGMVAEVFDLGGRD